MNSLKIFENNLFKVETKTVDNEILFDAESIARSLGFTDPKNNTHYVRWNRVNAYLPTNSPLVAKGDFIPEPLVYKLAFKAANDLAEKFQDWLAIDVIPSIRKNGIYLRQAPLNEKQQLMAAIKLTSINAEETEELKQVTAKHSDKIIELEQKVENEITLHHGEQRRLQKAVSRRVYKLADNDLEVKRRFFSELHREIKDRFGVASYKDVKRQELQSAIWYVDHWIPKKVLA